MSFIPSAIIRTYAESVGITNLSEDVIVALAQEVEYRAREVIQDAMKYMYHGKRTKLRVEDINHALEARNVERTYGYDPSGTLDFRLVPNSNIFYDNDRGEIDLEAFLQQPPPKAPQPLTLTNHWLAIDGIQPAIPENPNLQDPNLNINIHVPIGVTVADHQGTKIPLGGPIGKLPGTSVGNVTEVAASLGVDPSTIDAEVKPLVRHVLSKEMLAYYDTIIADLSNPTETDKVKAALHSISADPGLQQLVPYFVQHVAEMIPKSLSNLPQLQIQIGLLGALLSNEQIFVEQYLHQMMPSLLTGLLGKRLCSDPQKEDHWSLRDRCAQIIADLCKRYGNTYSTFIPRLSKTLLKTLKPEENRPLSSQYGAITGITAMGVRNIETLLMPLMESCLNRLVQMEKSMENRMTLDKEDEEGPEQLPTLAEIAKVKSALKTAAMLWLNETANLSVLSEDEQQKRDSIKKLFKL